MYIRVSSFSLGGAVMISTLCRFCMAEITFPCFPTTCFPMPGGITTICVLRMSIYGLLGVGVCWWACCGVCGLCGGVVCCDVVGSGSRLCLTCFTLSLVLVADSCFLISLAAHSPPFSDRWKPSPTTVA